MAVVTVDVIIVLYTTLDTSTKWGRELYLGCEAQHGARGIDYDRRRS